MGRTIKHINRMKDYLKNKKVISLDGDLLTSAYGVYVIIILKEEKRYVYFGQTGDAKHLSARGSFYRLAPHFGYSKSTQNQIYQFLRNHNHKKKLEHQNSPNLKDREDVEKWLHNAQISMHYYPIEEYKHWKDTKNNREKYHTPNRRGTLALETALLQIFKEQQDILLINKNKVTYSKWKDKLEDAIAILTDLEIPHDKLSK